jgi:predicted ester cyclase
VILLVLLRVVVDEFLDVGLYELDIGEDFVSGGCPGERCGVLTEAIGRWNAGDLDSYLKLYDDNIQLHGYTPQPMDKPAVRSFYEGIFAAFPSNQLDFHEVFGVDDRLTCRFTLSGRHGGTFLGVPPTDIQITLPGITILHFQERRCVERWSIVDMLGVLVQIGAAPTVPD